MNLLAKIKQLRKGKIPDKGAYMHLKPETEPLKVGDKVVRYLSSELIQVPVEVTAIDEKFIYCGDWKFNRAFGYEVDEDLGWGMAANGEIYTGSWIERVKAYTPSGKPITASDLQRLADEAEKGYDTSKLKEKGPDEKHPE